MGWGSSASASAGTSASASGKASFSAPSNNGREGTNAGPGGGANASAGKSGVSASASANASAGKSAAASGQAAFSAPSQAGKGLSPGINGNPSGNSYSEGNSVSSGAGAGKSVSVSVPSLSRSGSASSNGGKSAAGLTGLFAGKDTSVSGFMPAGGIQTPTGFVAGSQPATFQNVSLGKTSRAGVPALDSGRFSDGLTASAQLGVPSAGVAAKATGGYAPSTKSADFATAATIGNASKNDFSTMASANKATRATTDPVSRVSSYLDPQKSGYVQLAKSMEPVGAMSISGMKSQDPLQGYSTGYGSSKFNPNPLTASFDPLSGIAAKMDDREGTNSGPGNPSSYNNQGMVSTQVNVHDRIAKNEGTLGPNGYSTVYGGKQKDLANMSLAQTAALGVAAGKFQALPGTLRDFAKANGLDMNATKFTPAVQDAFGNWTIGRRIDAASKRPGGLTADNLGIEFTKEYASLAGPNGKSYYAGDGVNKAHNTWADTKAIAQNAIDINNGKFPPTVNTAAAATTQVAQNVPRDPYVSAPNYRGPTSTDAATTSTTDPNAGFKAPSGTASASAGVPAVQIDATGTAVPNSQTLGGKIAAGAIDVGVTTAGGIPGAVVEVAAQAIFGKTVGEMVVDSAGEMFTLNSDGTLTPATQEMGGMAEQKLRDDRAAAEQKAKDDEAQKVKDAAIQAAKDAVKTTAAPATDLVSRIVSTYVSPMDKYIIPSGQIQRT